MELDGLKVVHGGLEAAAADLMGIVSRIDARMQQLERELEPLRTSWIGEAQSAYADAKRRWDAAITEMRDLLRDTAVQVTRSDADYRAADLRGARSFGT
jgi:WXG100 family type VII secretion target